MTSVRFPENITQISFSMFENCQSLTTFTIPESVTRIATSAFENCRSLTAITIPESVVEIGLYVFWDCDSLTTVTIPDSVETIERGTFYSCDNLTTVNIPDSVKKIDMYAFKKCRSLTDITIPESVTTIGYDLFEDCSNLTSVTFLGNAPTISTSSVSFTVFEGVTATAFYPCSNTTWTSAKKSSYGGTLTWEINHSYGDYAIIKEATCALDAIWTGTCQGCGVTKTATIPDTAIGHKYDENSICLNCGKQFQLTIYMTDTYGDSWNGSAIEV